MEMWIVGHFSTFLWTQKRSLSPQRKRGYHSVKMESQRNLLKRTQKEEKLNTQTQFMAPLWWWMVGMGFAFFRLIAPFGGQKLEILGNSESGRRERPTFFLVEANFVLFHFSSRPHKNSEKVMDFFLLQTSWWFRTHIFHKTHHSSRHGRIAGIPLLNSRRPQTCCYLVS